MFPAAPGPCPSVRAELVGWGCITRSPIVKGVHQPLFPDSSLLNNVWPGASRNYFALIFLVRPDKCLLFRSKSGSGTSGVCGWVIKAFSVGAIGRFHEGCLSGFRRRWSMILADGWCLGLDLQEIFCPKRWVEIFHEGAFSQNCTVVQWARVFSLHM